MQFTGPGSTTGKTLGRRLWQPLCPAQASCALQWYLKPLLKATTPKAVLVPWVMAPWVDTTTQQQIPVYLQISYPAGAICLSVVTYHSASVGRACRVSSMLGLLFPTLCCAWAVPQLPAAAGGMGTAHEASGQASVHQLYVHGTCALLDLPCPGPLSLLKPRGGRYNLGSSETSGLHVWPTAKYTPRAHTHTSKMHKLSMTWVQPVLHECHFCYILQRQLAAGITYCTVIHCRAREKPFHISHAQGGLFLHNPQCIRHQRINIQQFEMFSSTASPICL